MELADNSTCWIPINTYLPKSVIPNVYDIRLEYNDTYIADFYNRSEVQTTLGAVVKASLIAWTDNCKFKGLKYVNWKNYGEYKKLDNYVFVKVYNAGHMMPYDQSAVDMELTEKFIRG